MYGKDALLQLAAEYEVCNKCQVLEMSRTAGPVFGSGSSSGPFMVVGGHPSRDEEAFGSPFMGDSGRLFMEILAKAWWPTDALVDITNIQEEETYFELLREYLEDYIFWTNVVLCPTPENRTPSAKEKTNCADRLTRTIYAVDPVLIIAAGKTAATALVGKNVNIADKHGTLFDTSVKSPVTGQDVRYPVLVTLDPGSLLKSGTQNLVKRRKGVVYETIQDIRYAFALIQLLYRDEYNKDFLEKNK